jgi:SAM-dependent methyltransferase
VRTTLDLLRPLDFAEAAVADGVVAGNNVAKFRVLARAWQEIRAAGGELRILDVGAGTGLLWRAVLPAAPGVRLTIVEPGDVAVEAEQSLPRGQVTIHRRPVEQLRAELAGRFNLVVSTSVLEHVRRKRPFLATCLEALRPDGLVLLTYDDSHFGVSLRNDLRNRVSQLLAALGQDRWYAKPVSDDEVVGLLASLGAEVQLRRYHSARDQKPFIKRLPESEWPEFLSLWLALEEHANVAANTQQHLREFMLSVYLEIVRRESTAATSRPGAGHAARGEAPPQATRPRGLSSAT